MGGFARRRTVSGLLAILPFSLVVSAFAAAAPPSATQDENADMVSPRDVISAISWDWDGDGRMDRAVLIDNGEDADLVVYLTNGKAGEKAINAPGLVFNGDSFGAVPALRLDKNHVLQVYAENYAYGDDHWDQTLTLAFRQGQFVITGLTFHDAATRAPGAVITCDIDYDTGLAQINGQPLPGDFTPVAVTDWKDDRVPNACIV